MNKTVYVLEEIPDDFSDTYKIILGIFEDMIEAEKAREELDKNKNCFYEVEECKVYNDCLDFFKEK